MGYHVSMRVLRLSLLLLLGTAAWADIPADRASIETVVRAVFADQTQDGKPVSTLFTADADNDLDKLVLLRGSKGPWSEVTTRVVIQSIRFITPDVALVDAANTQYGSMNLQSRIPVLLVMKKVGKDWRVASLRVLTDHPVNVP